MPWYRRNSATHPTNPLDWAAIANLYRKNSDGNWVRLRRVYRKNSSTGSPPNQWVIVHDSGTLTPYVTVAPELSSDYGGLTSFEDGDTLTLTRGTWANTSSAYSPVSYSLKIQYSTDATNWTDAVTGTGTSISYVVTLPDVRSPSYYFRGRVVATNVNGSSTPYNTTPTLSNMYIYVDNVTAYISGNQINAYWGFNKPNNSSNISSQVFKIINNSTYTYNSQTFPAGSVVYQTTIDVPTNNIIVPSGTNIKPGESHYATMTVTANDTVGSQDTGYSANFTSPLVAGTVSISPSFSSPNRVESGETVTAVTSGWPSGTTFIHNWYRSRSFSSQDDLTLATNSNSINVTTSNAITGERIWVDTYATSSTGQAYSLVTSGQYRIIPKPPVFTLGGGGNSITITSLTAVGGEYYYGTYSGPTSGDIPTTNIGTDYTISNLSTGTYTVTLFSGATNGSGFSLVATASNSSTSVQKSVVVLTPPTPTSAIFSNGTFYIYHSGGSGPYYQVWYNTSTTPNSNNPTSLGVITYDFNGSSSPIVWTPAGVNYGTTYNFWIRSSNSLTTTTGGEYSQWSTAYVQATPSAFAPTATSVSGSAGNLNVYFSGGSGPYYQVYWYPGDRSDIQTVTTYDANGSSSPINVTNLSAPSSGQTYYFWVRSVSSLTSTGTSSGSVSPWSNAVTWTAPVQPVPSGGSISLSGSGASNTLITASQSGWANSPTSYYTEIRASTTSPVTQSGILKASVNGSAVSYTITSSDAAAPAYYFRAFGYASNSGGQSSTISSNEILSFQVTVPGVPTNITCFSSLSSTNLNWNASWSPPTSNGGSAITGYDVYVQRATSSSGPWVSATTQIPAGSGAYTSTSPYSTTSTSVSGRITGSSTYTWVKVFVRAKNAIGAGSYGTAVG